ncbi:MAG: hypothetical protein V4726_11790 [Verrucomicrobiota bacterium]
MPPVFLFTKILRSFSSIGSTVLLLLLLLLLLLSMRAPLSGAERFGDFLYTADATSVSIARYTGSAANVIVPPKIGELPVTSIGDSAFSYYSGLVSVTLPEGLRTCLRSCGLW